MNCCIGRYSIYILSIVRCCANQRPVLLCLSRTSKTSAPSCETSVHRFRTRCTKDALRLLGLFLANETKLISQSQCVYRSLPTCSDNHKTLRQTPAPQRTVASKLFLRKIASWKFSTTSSQLSRQQPGSRFSNAALLFGKNNNSSSRVTSHCRGLHSGTSLCSEFQSQSSRSIGLVHLRRLLGVSGTDCMSGPFRDLLLRLARCWGL